MAAGGRVKVKFAGFDDLAAKINALKDPDEVGKVLRKAVRQGMGEVKKRAESLIPQGVDAHRTYKGRLVAPGFARRSIRLITKVDKSKQKVSAILGVRAEAFYALNFIELGTSKMPAQPWLRPAFAASADPAISQIAVGMKEWVEGIAAKKLKSGNAERASVLLSGLL